MSFRQHVGCAAISVFSLAYYWTTFYIILIIYFIYRAPLSPYSWLFSAPFFLSLSTPPFAMPSVIGSWFMKSMLEYFKFEVVPESPDEELQSYIKDRNCIFACMPHGVMSVCGPCWGAKLAPDAPLPPTAAASVIIRLPVLKHVIGMFGMIPADARTLEKQLKKTSVVLYPGGISEFFLSSPNEERLFQKARKGFIRLALQTGADVVPVYMFGNTMALEIIHSRFLRFLSRRLGLTITLMWGRWGLPIPLPVKCFVVRGRPLKLPILNNPSKEELDKAIDECHAKYLAEIERIFNEHKHKHPDYAHKQLQIE